MKLVSRSPSDASSPRIGALSVLPIFLNLTNKRAVVAGATAGAAWKAELLCAAGARVEVYAWPEAVGEEMARLASREPALTLIDRAWRATDIDNSAVAIADAESDE